MAVDVEEFAGNVDGQSAARAQLTAAATAAVLEQWRTFGDWYSTAAVGALTALIARRMTASKRAVASLTNAYLTRVNAQVAGKRRPPARLVDVDRLRLDPFTGAPQSPQVLQHTYGRPADRYRYLRAQRALELERLLAQSKLAPAAEQRLEVLRAGATVEQLRDTRSLEFDDTEFVEAALERAAIIVHDEHTLAMRYQARQTMRDDGRVDGYRRIIRPDLSTTTGVCGLCIAASDRIYHVKDLLDVHTGCNCDVASIINGVDPGQNLNEDDLKALYEVAGSTYAADLLRVRVKVAEHGELGPALTAYGVDPKLAPQVRRQQARQRLPDPGAATTPREDTT